MRLSVCYILKNEAEYIERSLRSIEKIADEIWIRDHGSTDGSLQKIEALQLKKLHLVSAEWAHDFSIARNEIAKKAKGEWILFLDGDEVLDESDGDKILKAMDSPAKAFSLIQRNYTTDSSIADVRPLGDGSLFYFENWMERLFRRDAGLMYVGAIHESLFPSAKKLGISIEKLPVILHHFGRLKSGHSRKLDYYRDLTRKKLEENRDEPAAWVEWMLTLDERQESEEALSAAEEAVNRFDQETLVLEVAYRVALRAGDYAQALSWIDRLLALDSMHEKAISERTIPLLYLRRWDECADICNELLKSDSKNFLAHLHLGIIFFERKQWVSAKRHLEIAASIKPHDEFLKSALQKIPSQQN